MIPSDAGDITFFLITCAVSLVLATIIFELISRFARWLSKQGGKRGPGLERRPTTRWSRPGPLRPRLIHEYPRAGRAAHLEAVRQRWAFVADVVEGHLELPWPTEWASQPLGQGNLTMQEKRAATELMLVAIVASALGACTQRSASQPDFGDGGFLSGTPCGAPCFFGIDLGSTTLVDAQAILAAAGLCPQAETFNNELEGGTRGFNCGTWITVGAAPAEAWVDGVGFSASAPMTIGDIVDALGPPNGVIVISTGIPESTRSTMLLFYDRLQTRILLPEQKGTLYLVEPTTPVERIVYFDEGTFVVRRSSATNWAGFTAYYPDQ